MSNKIEVGKNCVKMCYGRTPFAISARIKDIKIDGSTVTFFNTAGRNVGTLEFGNKAELTSLLLKMIATHATPQ